MAAEIPRKPLILLIKNNFLESSNMGRDVPAVGLL